MYEAIIAYRPRAEGELRLELGDKVSRSQDVGAGWVIAFNHRSGETGLVPLVCLTAHQSKVSRRLTRLVTFHQRQPHSGSAPEGSRDQSFDKGRASSNRVSPRPNQSPSSGIDITVDEHHDDHATSADAQQDSKENGQSNAAPDAPSSPAEAKATDGSSPSRKDKEALHPSPTSSQRSSQEGTPQTFLTVPGADQIEMSPLDQQQGEGSKDASASGQPDSPECSVLVELDDEANADDASTSAENAELKHLRSSLLTGPAKKKTVRIVIPEKAPGRRSRRSRRRTSTMDEEAEEDLDFSRDSFCRTALSLLMGCVAVGVLYMVLVWCFYVQHTHALLACCVTFSLMVVCLLLSRHCRALVVLAFPSMFTTLGRMVMLAVITQLILAGPGANILHNSRLLAATVTCVLHTAHNLTFAPADLCVDPATLAAAFQNGGRDLRQEVFRQLGEVKGEVNATLQVCQDENMDVVLTYNSNVSSQDGQSPALTAVSASGNDTARSDVAPDMDKTDTTPDGAVCLEKVWNLNDVIDGITDQLNRTLGSVDVIAENPHRTSRVTADDHHSKSSHRPQRSRGKTDGEHLTFEEEEEELQDPINMCAVVAHYLRKLLILAVILPFIESYLYLRRYLSRLSFDNVFLTRQLQEIDDERRRMGLHGVFPLRRRERQRYVDQSSWRLSPLEKSHFKSAITILIFHMLIYGMVLLVDFLLFFLLSLMNHELMKEIPQQTPTSSPAQPAVSGTGFLNNVLEQVISVNASATVNFTVCLNDYEPVGKGLLWLTLGGYITTLLLIFDHGYGCRLRQLMLSYYYPRQHEARTQHLYLNIYIKRKSFIREARDMIQPCVAAGDEADGFLEKKAAGSGLLRALCPCLKEPVYKCHNCKCYSSHMRRCNKEGCSTILCRNCLVDSSGVCPNCIEVLEDEEEEYPADDQKKNLLS